MNATRKFRLGEIVTLDGGPTHINYDGDDFGTVIEFVGDTDRLAAELEGPGTGPLYLINVGNAFGRAYEHVLPESVLQAQRPTETGLPGLPMNPLSEIADGKFGPDGMCGITQEKAVDLLLREKCSGCGLPLTYEDDDEYGSLWICLNPICINDK